MFARPIAAGAELHVPDARYCDELFALVDAERGRLGRWFAWVEQSRGVADMQAFVRRALEQAARDEGFNALVMVDGRVAGVVGFHDWRAGPRSAAVGYWLAAAAEGRGLATAAVRALLDYALVERDLHRVELRAATVNARSRAVAERLGFAHEGTLRQAEWIGTAHCHDLAVYSMLRPEWAIQRAIEEAKGAADRRPAAGTF